MRHNWLGALTARVSLELYSLPRKLTALPRLGWPFGKGTEEDNYLFWGWGSIPTLLLQTNTSKIFAGVVSSILISSTKKLTRRRYERTA